MMLADGLHATERRVGAAVGFCGGVIVHAHVHTVSITHAVFVAADSFELVEAEDESDGVKDSNSAG